MALTACEGGSAGGAQLGANGREYEGISGNPFVDFQIPRAILTLRQGVGRLMRSAEDRGVIAILDTRLFTKGYGRQFRKSLPPSPLTRELEAVATFFSQQ